MKLPAALLATLALAGCEQVDFEHRSAPAKAPTDVKAPVEKVRIIETQPAAAPIWKPAPPQTNVKPPPPTVKVRTKHTGCGEDSDVPVKCGMG